MKKRFPLWLAVTALAIFAASAWRMSRRSRSDELVLYGEVDFRQADLAFNGSERIAAVLVQEGQKVRRGQVLAALDTARLTPEVAQADAQVAAQSAALNRLLHGSRPEEIAQAAANVLSARADALKAKRQWERLNALANRTGGRGISEEEIDDAQAAAGVAQARLEVAEESRDLTVAGPRPEDIAQAKAQLQANAAQLALLHCQLSDAMLVAPADAVVRSRLLEPGEMASPQRPVFTLALTDPKWVRTYVAETDLGRVPLGAPASVTVDSFPDRVFPGRIGFISSIAEFTPKTIETPELRTSLVYEVRVLVRDPADDLRLGMPATVRLPSAGMTAPPSRETIGRALK